MKRTALRRKTPLRAKTPWTLKRNVSLKTHVSLRKHSSQSVSVLERKLWKLCKAIVRIIYPKVCYTCGQGGLKGKNCHTGHMWNKSTLGAFLKYDLRVLRLQCWFCNMDLGGNGAEFLERMIAERGGAYIQNLIKDKKVSVRANDHYKKLIDDYTEILEDLQSPSPTLSKIKDILGFTPNLSFRRGGLSRVGECS